MEILIRILVMLFLLLSGRAQTVPGTPPQPAPIMATPTPLPPNTVQSMVVIEDAQALILESYPAQIHLQVTGYHPDGCDLPVTVAQEREGNSVRVRIYRVLPIDIICPMVIVPYSATIPLEGGFVTGTYTIDVNGTILEIRI